MIVVVDYDMGNVHSVVKAFELLDCEVKVSNKKEDLAQASHIVLPGVGAFADGMVNLKKFGLIESLTEEVIQKKKPFLGICLGMQLLAKDSEEFGLHNGLGWLDASVKHFKLDNKFKIPHVGWNEIKYAEDEKVFNTVKKDSCFYFTHSLHMVCNEDVILATCDYGGEFTAAVKKNNIIATQFHPEKSQREGVKILKNFIKGDY